MSLIVAVALTFLARLREENAEGLQSQQCQPGRSGCQPGTSRHKTLAVNVWLLYLKMSSVCSFLYVDVTLLQDVVYYIFSDICHKPSVQNTQDWQSSGFGSAKSAQP